MKKIRHIPCLYDTPAPCSYIKIKDFLSTPCSSEYLKKGIFDLKCLTIKPQTIEYIG